MNIGGVEVETKVSLGNVLAIVTLLVTLVGGWYSLRDGVVQNAKDIQELQKQQQEQTRINEKLDDTLSKLNMQLGRTQQKLDDTLSSSKHSSQ